MTCLSELTTLRLGGPAHRIVDCRDEEELVEVVRDADTRGEPVLVLGGGSNLVVADEGFPGIVARVMAHGVECRDEGDRVLLRVQAGEDWDRIVERTVSDGLSGIEALSGIPGSVGATPIQNVGAYGQEVRETLVAVRVYDRDRQEVGTMTPEECGFEYRSSVFKRAPGRWVVLEVTVALTPSQQSTPIRYGELARALDVEAGDRAPLQQVRSAVLALRRGKGMVLDPDDPDTTSAGSFFLNPILTAEELAHVETRVHNALGADIHMPVFPERDGRAKLSAAWLIERAGFRRGYGNPEGIAISTKHTLALTNRGAGTTGELLHLAGEIAGRVRQVFGVRLMPEPVLVGCVWPERVHNTDMWAFIWEGEV